MKISGDILRLEAFAIHSLILRILIGTVAMVCALTANAQSFQPQPTQLGGIELIGPESPEFNTLLAKLVPEEGSRATLRPALAFSFIVRNSGARPIQTITARFEYTARTTLKPVAGTISQNYSGLQQGEFDLFLPGGSWTNLRGANEVALRHVPEFQWSPVVKASIDSVVYSDGQFAGPDQSLNFPHLSRERQQLNELLQELRGMQGQPVEAIRARLEQITKKPREMVGGKPIRTREVAAHMFLGVLNNVGIAHMQKVLSEMASDPSSLEVRR